MFKERPNRTVDEKIRGAWLKLRHHRNSVGLMQLKSIIEQAALESALDEARTFADLKSILDYMIRNRK